MDSMSIRILQIVLLATALVIALMNPVFNGLSILALACVALTVFLAIRHRAAKQSV